MSRKRKDSEQELFICKYKIRRGTKDFDGAIERRKVADAYALPQQEFTNRSRFVDQDGNSYALPKPGDAVYERYMSASTIGPIDNSGLPDWREDVEVGTSKGVYHGTALLYVRKKRSRKLYRVPRGTIQLLDTETMRLYTARVERAIFRMGSKSGHALLRDLTAFGTVSNPASFSLRP